MSAEATPTPNTGADAQGRRLESWKEIAGYLGRDVTTVRRWEKREGLPVHRLHHSKLGSIYAYTKELDTWRNERAPAAASEAPEDRQTTDIVGRGDHTRRVAALPAPVLTLAAGARAESNRGPKGTHWPRRWLAVCAIAVIAVVSIAYLTTRSRAGSAPSKIKSVVVLPLENFTGDPSQDYFVDGITDALITELAQVQGLRVISRTSAMHYRGARKTLPEISRELNVDAVVEGTVARSGDEVKITAQLIRASTDTHLWAGSYARVQSDILRLQAEVAREVARQISDQLAPIENKAGARPPVNPEAYEAYLKGLFFWNKESPEGARTAIRYFQGAIEKDRNFAAAYSRLASCYVSLAFMSEMSSSEAYAAAKEAVEKAVALDDNLDHAHTALAGIAMSDWDWTRAETEYKRALQLNPNSVNAHVGYFYLFLILGKLEEAAREERAAVASDPLSPHTLSISLSSAYYGRQYDDGLIKARTAIELYPQVSVFHVFLSDFYTAQGKDQLSAEEILLAEESGGASRERLAALKAANEMAGPIGLRRKRIELNKKLAAKQFMNAYDIAIDSAAVGDGDQAIAWLERALRARDAKISLIGVEPIFDNIRSDPRFVGLLRQMGLNQIRQQRSPS
ncbi:MAG TPA: hypothetical protein VNX66_13270 [Candidatus Sulfotelmatobacter sp.]|jgi:TolB-like protein|nr:hypothetical protein [Candidatus Sulfotelmatobacter sp.]